MRTKNQLLCTFASKGMLTMTLDYLKTYYSIVDNTVYLYTRDPYVKNSDVYLMYNIQEFLQGRPAKNTISVHRKKQSNTFYTINALNSLIREINNGVLDKNYPIVWENYTDSLLLSKDDFLEIIHLTFEKEYEI